MPAFVSIRFLAAVVEVRSMAEVLDLFGRPPRPVVAGEDDERLFRKPIAIEGRENFADFRIDHLHKVSVVPGPLCPWKRELGK